MLLSLVLFGSRARGDHHSRSDFDLLGIVEGGGIRGEVGRHGTSFYCYPLDLLRKRSEGGDLFLLHLTSEGVVLHDTANIFSLVRESFRYKVSYEVEIRQGSAVVWYLCERPGLLTDRSMVRRFIWGVRTILIARSAEKRSPVFSSAALAEFSRCQELKSIIDDRFSYSEDILIKVGVGVVEKYGLARKDLSWPPDSGGQTDILISLGGVAKITAQQAHSSSSEVHEAGAFYL